MSIFEYFGQQNYRRIKRAILNTFVFDLAHQWKLRKELIEWHKNGRPNELPAVLKQAVVLEYAAKYQLQILVETGTYLGAMVSATKEQFKRIVSIELDLALYKRACKKFARYPHILLVHGDSGELLEKMLSDIREPCLFWLDAHLSSGITTMSTTETPILQELSTILHHAISDHVILIDDARCFIGANGYCTQDELRDFVRGIRPDLHVAITNDIIRIHKNAPVVLEC